MAQHRQQSTNAHGTTPLPAQTHVPVSDTCPGCESGIDCDGAHIDENGDYYPDCCIYMRVPELTTISPVLLNKTIRTPLDMVKFLKGEEIQGYIDEQVKLKIKEQNKNTE